ncbi:MAG: oligosaccharide flippase family protein [Phycisphaerae bacterium]
MSRAAIYARNIFANYVGFIANVVVAFFLTPYIVHSLGDTRYGIWSLLVSLAGYFGVVDIGVRGSLGRFVNYYLGKDSVEDVNEILSTAVAFFCLCGLGILAVSGGFSLFLGGIFPKIEPEFLPQARVAILLIGLNMWIGFLAAFPPVILRSQDRFDLVNGVELLGLAVRTGLTVWVLWSNWGLIALGLVQIAMTTVQLIVGHILAKWSFPELRIRFRLAGLSRFGELMSFSFFAFLCNASNQLMLLADVLLITWFLGPKHVAYYSVALILVRYGQKILGMTGGVIIPEITKQCGREDFQELRWLFIRGSNLRASLGIGIWVGILAFGREFMNQWMGPDYDASYWVMAVLSAWMLTLLVNEMIGPIGSGLGKIRYFAALSLVRLAANVSLTVLFLLTGYGLVGVAMGTAISSVPVAIVNLIVGSRWFGLSVRKYLRESVSRWVVLGGSFGAVSCIIRLGLPSGNWGWLFLKSALAVFLYIPMVWFLLLAHPDRDRISMKIRKMMHVWAHVGLVRSENGEDDEGKDMPC